MLNFLLLGLQFSLTDKFLNDKFQWYGWEVATYYSYPYSQRVSRELAIRLAINDHFFISVCDVVWCRNPVCSVFPTVTSCDIPNVGAGGGTQVGFLHTSISLTWLKF